MGRLAYHVHVLDEDGNSHVFAPEGELPGWAERAITNPSAWEGGAVPDAESDGSEIPPRGGPGSGKDAWAQYAASNDVEVADGASRDDIISALEAAGVATE